MASNPKDLAPGKFFPSVRKAREALRGEAQAILTEFRTMIKQAAAAGQWEHALKAQQWLVDHLPAEDGERLFDSSVDRPNQTESKASGPLIQIVGIRYGNDEPKKLPEVIDVIPESD